MVEVKSAMGKINCPHCSSTRIYGHGWCKPRKVLHSWSNGKRVYLELCRQRWRCRECGRSFNDGAQLLRSYSRITRQAETEALWQLKDRSFSQVKKRIRRRLWHSAPSFGEGDR